ncbi:hypothetical protein QR680_013061 [Steinernema hermaphroditum]|uniref:WD repeat-containing protein 37 n=1 Tax=Steinernema hermaphroditum TaxID=289476 RepID=A0AA39M0Y7_9BILA|nr:hypothetical protein QR680_013061 [Steinernema hermaphroditum]
MPGGRGVPESGRLRSATDGDMPSTTSTPLQHADSGELEGVAQTHKVRLYQLFSLIEKEFDALEAENAALRAKLSAISSEKFGEGAFLADGLALSADIGSKGSGTMQMGQKLKTALRGPSGRLVYSLKGAGVGFDSSRHRYVRHFSGHTDGVWHVSVSPGPSPQFIASASADATARFWNASRGHCLLQYVGHNGSVNGVAFHPSGADSSDQMVVATSSGDQSTHVWKTPSLSSVPPGASAANPTVSSEDELDASEKEEDGDPDVSSLQTVRSPLVRLTGHSGVVIAVDWLPGGEQLATASWDRTGHIYDVERGEITAYLTGHDQELNYCHAHKSQKLIVTSSKDSTFRLWDFRDPIQSVAVYQGHTDSVTSVVFSSGDQLISGSDDRTVKVWDLKNMRSPIASIRLDSAANRLAVSHNLIAIPHDNRHVRIYDLSGSRVARLPRNNARCHRRMVCCAAWVNDNVSNNLVTCGFDRQIIGWKSGRVGRHWDESDSQLTTMEHRLFDALRGNSTVKKTVIRSTHDDGIPFWRVKQILSHMRGQTNDQLQESGIRRKQILHYESELQNPFFSAPGANPLYYENPNMCGCEKGRSWVIPSRFRVHRPPRAQCCARCVLQVDAMNTEFAKRVTKRRNLGRPKTERSEEECFVDFQREPKRKPKTKTKTILVIVEEPKDLEEENAPREEKKTTGTVHGEEESEGDALKPPIYGTAELEVGLKDVLRTTRKTLKAVRNVRFVVGDKEIDCDVHLNALEKLQKSVQNYKQLFDKQKQETNRLLGNRTKLPLAPTAGNLGRTQTVKELPSVATKEVRTTISTVPTVTDETKPTSVEWGAKTELTFEKTVSEAGPQFSNVRPDVRTRPRESHTVKRITVDGREYCRQRSTSVGSSSVSPFAPQRSSLMDIREIRRERGRLQEERAELAIEKAKWTQEKVERKISECTPCVRKHFRSVMQQKSAAPCWSAF